MKTNHILFLSSSNLPTNPRLLKEIDLQGKRGKLTVVLFRLGNWSDAQNQKLMDERAHIRFITLDATRSRFFIWLMWALAEKTGRFLSRLFPNSIFWASLGLSRRSIMMRRILSGIEKPSLIIAHTLGALYPATYWAGRWEIPFAYDAEDYDPGIHVPQAGKNYISSCETVLKNCLPRAAYITSASPLIGQYTLNLIGGHPNHRVILNSFPQKEFIKPSNNQKLNSPDAPSSSPLKLIWFSQRISFGRGLEPLLDAIKHIVNASISQEHTVTQTLFELTLIGDMDAKFNKDIVQPFLSDVLRPIDVGETMSFQSFGDSYRSIERIRVELKPPMPQHLLHQELSRHDVGLALEVGKDLNNKLAVSNKIIAYAQSGLYILATDTPAQQQFMESHPWAGIVCAQDVEGIVVALRSLQARATAVQSGSDARFKQGDALSWEKESHKLLELWAVKDDMV